MEGKKEETAPVVNSFYWNRAKNSKKKFNFSLQYFCKIIVILRFSKDNYGHPMEGSKRFQNPRVYGVFSVL